MIFHFFDCSSPFFFVNWISLYFFPFLIKYYHIMFIIIVFRLISDQVVSSSFAGFLLFSAKESVTGCYSSLGSFCYSIIILHFEFMHLLSGYCYSDNVINGVLRPSWLNKNSLLNFLGCVFMRLNSWMLTGFQFALYCNIYLVQYVIFCSNYV